MAGRQDGRKAAGYRVGVLQFFAGLRACSTIGQRIRKLQTITEMIEWERVEDVHNLSVLIRITLTIFRSQSSPRHSHPRHR